MAMSTRSASVLKGALRVVVVTLVLWLVIIAPFVSIFALLNGNVFYVGWAESLLYLPWPLLLFLGVFRSKNRAFRWWVFQYLGVCAVCFSGALVGILLSLFLPFTTAGQIALLACVLFCSWGVYAAHRIHVVKLAIVSNKIKQPLRLVQISDVHVGSRRAAYLEKVMKIVDAQRPDILAITGDLIDEDVLAADLTPLSNLTYPSFYCSGNHERYVNYQQAIENISDQGVTVLSDSVASCLGLRIVGVEDREHVAHAEVTLGELKAAQLSDMTPFSVLLYHQPDLWECAKHHGIDLTLSGHTHKGQVWPFGLLVRTRYRHVAGLFKDASSHLFVSQGTGTWGPIMRFGTRCEITVIELQGEN